ncbi:unnamed protein product, partial [Phaeothamnion confervicola]
MADSGPSLLRLQVYREALAQLADGLGSYAPFLREVQAEYDGVIEVCQGQMREGLKTKDVLRREREEHQGAVGKMQAAYREVTTRLEAEVAVSRQAAVALAAQLHGLQAASNSAQSKAENLQQENDDMKKRCRVLCSSITRMEEERELRQKHATVQQSERLNLIAATEKLTLEVESCRTQIRQLEAAAVTMVTRDVMQAQTRAMRSVQRELGAVRQLYRSLHQKYAGLQHAIFAVNAATASSDGYGDDSNQQGTGAAPDNLEDNIKDALRGKFRGSMSGGRVIDLLLAEVNSLRAQVEADDSAADGSKAGALARWGGIGSEGWEPPGNYFAGRGLGEEVPLYLRIEGPVKNMYLPRMEVEKIVQEIWRLRAAAHDNARAPGGGSSSDGRDSEEDESHAALPSETPGSLTGTAAARGAGTGASVVGRSETKKLAATDGAVGGVSAAGSAFGTADEPTTSLGEFFHDYLRDRVKSHGLVVEWGYNITNALEAYTDVNADLRMFLLVLNKELPEEIHDDLQLRLAALLNALEAEDLTANSGAVSGQVPLQVLQKVLQTEFPTKPRQNVEKLLALAKQETVGKNEAVPYLQLFEEDEDGRGSKLGEALKDQHISELLAYARHLRACIQ